MGPHYPDVATSYNNLANVLCDQGDLKQAKEYEQRAYATILFSLHFASVLETSEVDENPRAVIVLVVRKNMRLPEKAMQGYREFSTLLLQSSTNYTRALLRASSSHFFHVFSFPFPLNPVIVGLKRDHI